MTGRSTADVPLLGAALLVVASMTVAAVDMQTYRTLYREDGWGEWATALAFFAAAGVYACAARQLLAASHAAGWRRFIGPVGMCVLLSAFALFVAGEELSWGQRLFGYRPPDAFLAHNFQQESNLHNLLKPLISTRVVVAGIALVWGVVGPVVARLGHAPAWLCAAPSTVAVFAAVAAVELIYPVKLSGEVAELLLGLAFVGDAMARWSGAPTLVRRGLLWACLALAAPIPGVVDALTVATSAELARTEAVLQRIAIAVGADGVITDAGRGKRSIHKRVYTAIQAGYIDLGRRAAGVDPYFLDPWQSPLWIRSRRRGGKMAVMVYSFGPNRRRDTDTRKVLKALHKEPGFTAARGGLGAGDDVAVGLSLRIVDEGAEPVDQRPDILMNGAHSGGVRAAQDGQD